MTDGLSGGDIQTVILNAAGRAVQREGLKGRVSRLDIVTEVESVRLAKSQIGAIGAEPRVTQSEEVRVADLPPDVRDRYEEAVQSDDDNSDPIIPPDDGGGVKSN